MFMYFESVEFRGAGRLSTESLIFKVGYLTSATAMADIWESET